MPHPTDRIAQTYTSRGALAGTRNSSMGPHHGGSIRRPIATSRSKSVRFGSPVRSSIFLNFLADRPNCAKFPSLKCAHISLWLNPTGHSKFHNTSKPPSACYRFRSDCSYSLVPALIPPPLFFHVPDRGTGEGRYLCP